MGWVGWVGGVGGLGGWVGWVGPWVDPWYSTFHVVFYVPPVVFYVAPCKPNADLAFWNAVNCTFGCECIIIIAYSRASCEGFGCMSV